MAHFVVDSGGIVAQRVPREKEEEMTYITTREVPAALVSIIADLLPCHARSVVCLHGETEADPVRYRAHENEIHLVRRAIRQAKA